MSNDAWHKARVEAASKAYVSAWGKKLGWSGEYCIRQALKAADSMPLPGEDEMVEIAGVAIRKNIQEAIKIEELLSNRVGYHLSEDVLAKVVIEALRPWIGAQIAK